MGEVTGKFYTVFLNSDRQALWSLIWDSLVLFLAATAIYATTNFIGDMFAFLWRRRLTSYLIDRYTRGHAFYWVTDVDNPDQRLAQDLNQWSQTMAEILKDLAAVPYNLIYYTIQVHKRLNSFKVLLAVYLWFFTGTFILK